MEHKYCFTALSRLEHSVGLGGKSEWHETNVKNSQNHNYISSELNSIAS